MSVSLLNVILLNATLLNATLLNDAYLNVTFRSVILLNVVSPTHNQRLRQNPLQASLQLTAKRFYSTWPIFDEQTDIIS